MPNTFDPQTFSRIIALAIAQDVGVSALSIVNEFMSNGGSKILTNSLVQYGGYVAASAANNIMTPAILIPIVDNSLKARLARLICNATPNLLY